MAERRTWATERERMLMAQAWDDGLDAGRDRWMDSREFGDAPVNPYLSGEDDRG